AARGGYVLFFIGSFISAFAVQSFTVLLIIFALSLFCFFVYSIYKMSQYMSLSGMIGLIAFEILFWSFFITVVIFVCMKLYNGILASLPFAK
ncbi:DUF5366 family protein, partial [Ureibacillus thermosphaericus]|uniref:DUF5366 family protein n=1 Tax=Ureibacillus thermosphaericus TaxID=51173 RepID=UPI0030C96537